MKKEELYEILKENNIEFEKVDHAPAYTVEDIISFNLSNPEWGAKNLFLRDDKKRNYYLLVAPEEKQINIKDFQEKAGTRRLSFGSEDDLKAKLDLYRGAVSPFGILNNIDKVHTTSMGIDRIKKNINIDDIEYLKELIKDKNCNIYKQGKNYYCEINNIKITINSYSYTIITAHLLKR